MPYITQVAVGRREYLGVFGDDYHTADGTCLRDYIHVTDLAKGHVLALKKMEQANSGLAVYNLGTGIGYSVLDVIQNFEAACGLKIPYKIEARRDGDVPVLYADPSKAKAELGFEAVRDIRKMCEDAWRWQSMNPKGYES
jgi:UDP-glucose 4-epimerase